MLWALIVAVVGAMPSLGLILWIERGVQRIVGAPLARWQRLLIPMPMILWLFSVVGDKLLPRILASLIASRRDDPEMLGSLAGFLFLSRMLVPWVGLLIVVLLPFALASAWRERAGLLLVIWRGHLIWSIFPFLPWFLLVGGEP